MFQNIGWNFLKSFTYNYGLNFIVAGAGSWGMIESGVDWKWRNTMFENPWTLNFGRPVMVIGVVVPVITPLVFYVSGKYFSDERMSIASSALIQTVLLTLAVQSPLKMITGRRTPGLASNRMSDRIEGEDDFSREFNWFNMDFINGWPSGHTANAFSAAATIAEIYHDNILVKIGAYTYAALIGIGVTTHAHWASEAFAGALIGYAVGKTVGKSFRKILENGGNENPVSFYFTPSSAGIIIRR